MEKAYADKKAIVKKLLKNKIDIDSEDELMEMLIDRPLTIDVEKKENENITKGDKLADKLAEVAGSWKFIICFSLFLICWITLNGFVFKNEAIDDYPFILLNLMLSCLAALQAPVIMMSQNRQAKKDSIRNQNDYCVDLKSELILEDLHDNMKEIIKNQKAILKYLESDYEKDSEKN